jgi:hypothetical protein
VNHTLVVRVIECFGDLAREPNSIIDRKLAFARESLAQPLAGHERCGVVDQAIRDAGGDHGNDVWMLKAGRDANLALEALECGGGGPLGRQHLHHHLTTECGLFGDEESRHATATELALEGERRAE